jgi:hypothetical protein
VAHAQFIPGAVFQERDVGDGCDLCIIQRDDGLLRHAACARTRFLWLHDWASPHMPPDIALADRILLVSAWAAEEQFKVANRGHDRFLTVRNGSDLELIAEALRVNLIAIWPQILTAK